MNDHTDDREPGAAWHRTRAALERCRDCQPLGVLHQKAKPLFGRFEARRRQVLFVFEAPNLDDTVNPQKGYLTYDAATDPTGIFTHQLLVDVLGMSSDAFQVTNAVLCLPAARDGKFPVLPSQLQSCSEKLRRQIDALDPVVVASVGGTALDALRRLEDHGLRALKEAVAHPRPWLGRWLFPLAHTSRLGRRNRKERDQVLDWIALREFLASKGVSGGT
jgi:uracil-DNA glycosylase family 4